MKNMVLMMALSMSIVAAGALTSTAQDAGGAKNRASFEQLDANGDGQLVRAELDAHAKARFDRADANGDGVLSRAELEARSQKRSADRIDRVINRLDANKDGAVSFGEMSAVRGGKLFDRADADGNGAVTKAEFEQARASFKDKRKGSAQ